MDEQRIREIVREEIAAIRAEEQRQVLESLGEIKKFNGNISAIEVTATGSTL